MNLKLLIRLTRYFIINHDLTKYRFHENGRNWLGNKYLLYIFYNNLFEYHAGFTKHILYDLQVIFTVKYLNSKIESYLLLAI